MRRTFIFIAIFLCVGSLSVFAMAAKKDAAPAMKSAECLACHNDPGLATERDGKQIKLFVSEDKFKASIHGSMAFECTQCHTDIKAVPHDPKSPIFKFNVPQTCAKCHEGVKTEFLTSIHGQQVTRGNWQAPVCTDCHGIHLIKRHDDPTSPVSNGQLAKATCARCHESVRL